jgi:hypothetical protein
VSAQQGGERLLLLALDEAVEQFAVRPVGERLRVGLGAELMSDGVERRDGHGQGPPPGVPSLW